MKAIVVTDEAAGTAGMTLVKRPEPEPAINDVVVEVHASGFTSGELTWPSTWTDRLGRDRTPSIPGQELAGVVTALGYGTTGLSLGQRVFGMTDSYRGGGLAEYVAIEARNLAPLPGDVDFTVGASLPISGLTAWQGLFERGHLQAGQSARPATDELPTVSNAPSRGPRPTSVVSVVRRRRVRPAEPTGHVCRM
jgi:NADPH:quinone reductase-like Zn-dependent oxidoreductase